jgi:hypothetical protein
MRIFANSKAAATNRIPHARLREIYPQRSEVDTAPKVPPHNFLVASRFKTGTLISVSKSTEVGPPVREICTRFSALFLVSGFVGPIKLLGVFARTCRD